MTPDTSDRDGRSDWESVHVCPNCGHIINLALTDPRRVYEAEYWGRGFPPPAPFPFVAYSTTERASGVAILRVGSRVR
jgi:hypothetical protein